jgi:protein TonB
MKKNFYLIALIIGMGSCSIMQKTVQQTDTAISKPLDKQNEQVEDNSLFDVQSIDTPPEFRGGNEARLKYLSKNMNYPKEARNSDIQGAIYLNFIIERDGSITNVKVIRGIGGGCDEEAARVVRNMPKWEPGLKNGKPVRVSFMMPIKFVLNG